MRITEDYDSHTKDDLLAECHTRGIEGINTSSLKADIVAALELNDEQNAESETDEPAPIAPETPKPEESPIPHIGKPNIDNIPEAKSNDVALKNEDFTGGLWKMRPFVIRVDSEGKEKREPTLHPNEVFALCVHPPDTYGKTHSLKNSLHFWQGSEGQFVTHFEKA